MTVKKIPPSRRAIPKFPYLTSRPRENQLGQLMRWLLAAVGTTIKQWCADQEGLHQNSFYNATCVDYQVTAKMVETFARLIDETVGAEGMVTFEEIRDLVGRHFLKPPLAWREVAEEINREFHKAWPMRTRRKKVKR